MGRVLIGFIAVLGLASVVFSAPIPVLVTIPPYEKIVSHIGGPYIKVASLLGVGTSDEVFEPDVKMLRAVVSGRLYFSMMVLPLEKGLVARMSRLNPELKVVSLALPESSQDPHLWLSFRQVMRQVPLIVQALSAYDPAHKATYQQNGALYLRYLKNLDERVSKDLSTVQGRAFLIEHPTLGYFARDYGLIQLSVYQREGKSLSPRALQQMLARARQLKPRILVKQPDTSESSMAIFEKELVLRAVHLDPMARDFDETLQRLAWQLKQNL